MLQNKPKEDLYIYDGSAKCNNICLNSLLHQGKDDLQRFSDVLIRFRRFPVEFSCDIQKMFMQCGINEKDRDLLRILWFENHDFEAPVITYRFKRLPFGINCSMSMANYCLKKTATDNDVGASPETVDLVKNSFYVDDGLISCKNVEEGIFPSEKNRVASFVGSVIKWLERCDSDRHGLGSKLSSAILLYPRERQFTSHGSLAKQRGRVVKAPC